MVETRAVRTTTAGHAPSPAPSQDSLRGTGAAPRPLDRLSDPLADPVMDRRRLRLAAFMAAMGVLHFVLPRPFEAIIPRWFPWRRPAVLWSGAAEVASGALLALPRTARAGGALTAATLVAVYPANVQMAIDAHRGRPQVAMPTWLAWARLPLQVPLILAALRIARPPGA